MNTRQVAIDGVIASVKVLREPCTLIACVGSPECRLDGDDAMLAQKAGCRRCDRFAITEDGTTSRLCDA